MISLKESLKSAYEKWLWLLHTEEYDKWPSHLDKWAEGYIGELEKYMLQKAEEIKSYDSEGNYYSAVLEVLRFLRGETISVSNQPQTPQ